MLDKLYGFRVLDCVVETAIAIASDYYARPNQHARVEDKVAGVLQNFKSRVGADPQWPDFAQRQAMFAALLGPADGESAFSSASQGVHVAATNYAEGGILHGTANGKPIASAGEPALRQAFVDALGSFEGVLSVVSDTAALKSAAGQIGAVFEAAVTVLQSPGVARAFGVDPAPHPDWPLTTTQSGKGAFLVERISKQLAGGNLRPVRLQQFFLFQRVSAYGVEVIGQTLDGRRDPKDIDKLIQDAYSWASASSQLAAYRSPAS